MREDRRRNAEQAGGCARAGPLFDLEPEAPDELAFEGVVRDRLRAELLAGVSKGGICSERERNDVLKLLTDIVERIDAMAHALSG